MKTLTTILALFMLLIANAQTNYEKGMTKAMALYGEGKVDEAANLFERIGNAEQEKWLPYYYVAQININKSWNLKDETLLKAQLSKAQDNINLAQTPSNDNPEVMILQAQVYTAWIVFDGQRFGMSYSGKVSELYSKAAKLAPENPRVAFSKVEWDMGTARFFGKDIKPFCAEIEKTIPLFDTFKADESFYPTWGKERAEGIIAQCKQ